MCEAVVDCPHSTPVWTDSGYVVLRNQNIKDGRLDLSAPSYTDEEHFKHRVRRMAPRAGDIVITREAPMGDVCKVPEGLTCCLGQRQVLLRPKVGVNSDYLLYALQSPFVQDQIRWNEGTGSTVSNIRIPVLEKIEIPRLGSSEESIADALRSLDAKIDVNRRINQTLEAMAQAIFKSWFVDFDPVKAKIAAKAEGRDPLRAAMTAISGKPDAELDTLPPDQFASLAATAALFPDEMEDSELGEIPKGWLWETFGTIAELSKGSVNPLLSPERVFEHYSLPAFDAGKQPVVEEGAQIKSNKTKFARGSVLQSKLNPHIPRVWFPLRVSENAVCSTEFLPWIAKEPASPSFLYCLLTSDLFGVQVRSLVTGTSNSHQRVKPDQVSGLLAVVPPKDLLSAFTKTVDPFFERVESGTSQMRDLAGLRDALLPKLLSGELQVQSIEPEVAA
ncbi:restriction endonuclease subunit S [Hydrogenophaga taeniospiralis]|nr:restriction endonuclease subunit S [Hydrogenophaga taeniospiralis]